MALEALSNILRHPVEAIEAGSVERWTEIEEIIGTPLPVDYRQYVNTLGSGCIGAFLWPFNPFSESKFLNLIQQINVRLSALRDLKEQLGEAECPYPLYPETGGLLPWGATDNGDVFFWLTGGHPDTWIVILNEARGPVYEEYAESMTGVLAKLVAGELGSEIIPSHFIDRNALFVPAR